MNYYAKAVVKLIAVPFLLIGSVTACGYNDGARTNVYDGNNVRNVTPYNAETDGYMNRYYTDRTGQYYNIPSNREIGPELDDINDAPTRKAEELRNLNGR